ncbi:hypothetical protein DY000_02020597 [Brassica cretica]|uniref:FBD domain-containing protein n=1 Tax=Brassica cretica TaxID=69181 RepID=A0ABQ7EHI2_BRACR|nr:hypothetical protein DY000_02020597 [Brassica cretica]
MSLEMIFALPNQGGTSWKKEQFLPSIELLKRRVYILHEDDGFGIEDALEEKLVGFLELLTFLLNFTAATKGEWEAEPGQ